MENNQNTNKLKKQQKQILFLLYKFRFLTINRLQKYFNHKDPHRVKERLKDLANKGYISRIERGEENPSFEILHRIAEVLKVKSAEILPF